MLDERSLRTRARLTNIFSSGWSEGASEDPTYFGERSFLYPYESESILMCFVLEFKPFASCRATA